MLHQRMFKFLQNKLHVVVRMKCLDFEYDFNCISNMCLELLGILEAFSLGLQHIQPHIPQKISIKVAKYLALPTDAVLMGSYMLECTLPKGFMACLSPFFWKWCIISFTLNACFTNQRKYGIKNFTKVHATHYNLECMNVLVVQMAKPVEPKLDRAISRWGLHQVGCIYFVNLYEVYLVVLSSEVSNIHLPRVNCTFDPLDISLLTENKYACKLGIRRAF